MTSRRRRAILVGVPAALIAGCVVVAARAVPQAAAAPPAAARFPDAAMAPTPGWTGPVFRLSQDYPQTPPAAEDYPWLTIDFRTQPAEYARAVLKYAVEGNDAVDWLGQDNAVRPWYHAPWLHWGANGREFVHGLTHERVSLPGELAPGQTGRFQNWAVGMYNPPAGYTIGRVWRDAEKPDAGAAMFPEGSVGVKLLFTAATVDQVPFLANTREWKAFIYRDIASPADAAMPRAITTLRLLQVDIAVRDRRADSTTGWVLGTFMYNARARGETVWDRMQPVGLMWGGDPGVTAADVSAGTATLKESAIVQPPRGHLGWAGRLNGPVDNPMSSCISCHATAQWPALSPMVPPSSVAPGSVEWMRWFLNTKSGQPFDFGATSLDYSLQLALGLANFADSQGRAQAHTVTRDEKNTGRD
jgi:hypothetical protein